MPKVPWIGLSLCCCACTLPPRIDPRRVDGVDQCQYELVVLRAHPLNLDVTASCEGPGILGLSASTPEAFAGLGSVTSDVGPLLRRSLNFELLHPARRASFHYQLDLDAIAGVNNSFDVALRRGASILAPSSTFLLHPVPLDLGTPVEVRLRTPPGFGFLSGLQRHGESHQISAHEIPVSTYAVFGSFEQRSVVIDSGRARLELAMLGADFSVSAETVANWLRVRAQAVSTFFGGFPAERTLVALVSEPNQGGVRFGKLLPESAPGVALLVGSEVTERELSEDWILVHELFHIGVPSFHREGKWFDEGLATYFEPIVRVRAGLLSELELWREFLTHMPKGLPALTREGLAQAHGGHATYWGGALYCLMADLLVRRNSKGQLGVEDGLRHVLASDGNASEVWELSRMLATADSVFEHPVLVPLALRYAKRPGPLDLAQLFADLGVKQENHRIQLRDDAPLAWVRKTLVHGSATRSGLAREAQKHSGLKVFTPSALSR